MDGGDTLHVDFTVDSLDLFITAIYHGKFIDYTACGANYSYHSGSCYRMETSVKLNFTDASRVCQEEGAHLVDIGSQAEQELIATIMDASASVGGASIGLYGWYPLVRWTDGSAPLYTNYDDSTFSPVSTCFKIRMADFIWRNIQCRNTHSYICEKDGEHEKCIMI